MKHPPYGPDRSGDRLPPGHGATRVGLSLD
jgi:hypothetical protein